MHTEMSVLTALAERVRCCTAHARVLACGQVSDAYGRQHVVGSTDIGTHGSETTEGKYGCKLTGVARELALTARTLNAEQAMAAGLVSEVFPDRAALDAAVMQIGQAMAGKSPLAITGTKRTMLHSRHAASTCSIYVCQRQDRMCMPAQSPHLPRSAAMPVTAYVQRLQ